MEEGDGERWGSRRGALAGRRDGSFWMVYFSLPGRRLCCLNINGVQRGCRPVAFGAGCRAESPPWCHGFEIWEFKYLWAGC